MSWTYSGDPSSDDRNAVRFLTQDTDTNRQLATNEEIDWVITQEMNVYMAAASMLQTIINRQAGIGSKKVGDLSITFDFASAEKRVGVLKARGQASYQVPTAGGIGVADKQTLEGDSDWPKPFFKREQFDHNGPSIDSEES